MLHPTGKVNAFDQFDYRRSYLLPATVITNVPRDQSRPGGYGAHEYARGPLIETARLLEVRPDELHYGDGEASCAQRPDLCPDQDPRPLQSPA